MAERKLRYEWEGTLRRLALPPLVKLVAAYAAQYANTDGRHVRPGVERLALETGLGTATIKRHLRHLRELGLIVRVRSGSAQGRRGQADEYRLTIPEDILERVPMVTSIDLPPVDNSLIPDHQVIPDPDDEPGPQDDEQGSPGDTCSNGTGITSDQNRDHQVIPHHAKTTPAFFNTPTENSLTGDPLTPREPGEPVDEPPQRSPPKCDHGLERI